MATLAARRYAWDVKAKRLYLAVRDGQQENTAMAMRSYGDAAMAMQLWRCGLSNLRAEAHGTIEQETHHRYQEHAEPVANHTRLRRGRGLEGEHGDHRRTEAENGGTAHTGSEGRGVKRWSGQYSILAPRDSRSGPILKCSAFLQRAYTTLSERRVGREYG